MISYIKFFIKEFGYWASPKWSDQNIVSETFNFTITKENLSELFNENKNKKILIMRGNKEQKKFIKLSLFLSKKILKKNWCKYTCINTA